MKPKNRLILRALLCLLLMLFCHNIYAQLSPFSLALTPAPQTCLGNGALNFAVSGTTPGAAIEFEVYLLPNTTQPVTTVTTLSATGLVSGDYKVVATQTLSGQSNTTSANATVIDNTVPFFYTTTVVNKNCQQEGSITVVVTSGTAVSYEITSGPQTFPQQPSNVFSGLQAGQYQVRVYDSCGNALVTTVTVSQQSAQIYIGSTVTSQGALPSCTTTDISYVFFTDVAEGQNIAFPVTIKYTVHPPGGGPPVIVTGTVASGFTSNSVTEYIPFYHDQQYSFDIEITDACGNTFTREDNLVYRRLYFTAQKLTQSCNAFYMSLTPYNYVLPYTVSFISSPTGFNPSQFNSAHPVINDPYTQYGTPDNPVPMGTYVIQITDACGHTAQNSITLEEGGVPKVTINQGADCFYTVNISMPNSRDIASATLTEAPVSFGTVPQNMMAFASGASLYFSNATPGHYECEFTDVCGTHYTVEFDIVAAVDSTLYWQQGVGCTPGVGSVLLYAPNGDISSLSIVSAPAGYTAALPLDVTSNIVNGNLYMNSLPDGLYNYESTDNCGNPINGSFNVIAYVEVADPAAVIYNCGSFDIDLHNGNEADMNSYYWLQKYDEDSGEWVHPEFGQPNSGLWLNNNALNLNFTYTGQFRIVRRGSYYINGSEYNVADGSLSYPCFNELLTFTFTGAPVIEGAYAFPCSNGLSEVIIDAVGVPPLEYAITKKDGEPFVVNNGADMTFMALENAVYNFSVTDDCGNIVTIQYDITNLKPLEIMQEGFCEGEPSALYVKSYTFLTYEWWKESDPGTILSTTNRLDFPSFDPAQMGVYHLKIVSTTPGSCIDIVLEHTIELPHGANAGEDRSVTHCNAIGTINLNDYLSEGHDIDGLWKDASHTGYLNGSVLRLEGLEPGVYEFTYTVAQCGIKDEAIVTLDVKGAAFSVDIDAGCTDFKYLLSISNISDIAEPVIVWEGPGNFTATTPVVDVSGLAEGKYDVTVTNADGCIVGASVMVEATSCEMPKGVSPNGDGMNDYFDLSVMDIDQIKIFNRYGLIIYQAENYKKEWYGQTDSGKEVPTGTYYYVVTLATGKQVTGWVYLQREL